MRDDAARLALRKTATTARSLLLGTPCGPLLRPGTAHPVAWALAKLEANTLAVCSERPEIPPPPFAKGGWGVDRGAEQKATWPRGFPRRLSVHPGIAVASASGKVATFTGPEASTGIRPFTGAKEVHDEALDRTRRNAGSSRDRRGLELRRHGRVHGSALKGPAHPGARGTGHPPPVGFDPLSVRRGLRTFRQDGAGSGRVQPPRTRDCWSCTATRRLPPRHSCRMPAENDTRQASRRARAPLPRRGGKTVRPSRGHRDPPRCAAPASRVHGLGAG